MNEKNVLGHICVGQFAGAHGVRGLAKLRSFTEDPEDIFGYAPLTLDNGTAVKLELRSAAKDVYIVAVEGIASKEAADQMRGDRLYVARDLLPPPGDSEYFEADLIGLRAVDEAGKDYGKVISVHDHGAGVFLEIGSGKKDSFMLPFKDAFVPKVDVAGGRIEVAVPEGWL